MEKYDLIVLGAGAGGLVVTAVAAQLGYRVALLEGGRMGGDCLNEGCIPSKALLAAANIAHTPARAGTFGIQATAKVDFAAVMAHVKDVVASIAPHDSVERFEELGATVIREYGFFIDPRTVGTPTGRKLTARRIVVATGSRAAVPPIPGLDRVPYLTNETIFDLTACPAHLGIIGAGAIGMELAQAFARLGSKVTVLEAAPEILPQDNPELAAQLRAKLETEGLTIRTNTQVAQVRNAAGKITVYTGEEEIEVSHLLVAAGRMPNVEQLKLEAAGIAYDKRGITVNAQQRTSNRRVFALGDVTGPYRFTHMAGEQAGTFIKRVLFGSLFVKTPLQAVPWTTYTDPELGHVGLTQAQARAKYGKKVQIVRVSVGDVDRNRTEQQTTGEIQVAVGPKGRVLGVDVLGPHAGELLPIWGLMIGRKLKLAALAGVIHAYPTFADLNRKVVSAYYSKSLYAGRTRWVSRVLYWVLG